MSNILYAEAVLQVGSLVFMEAKSTTFLFGRSIYYWKFKDSSLYYGPFNSLSEAGLSVDEMLRDPKGAYPTGTVETPSPAPVVSDGSVKEIPNNLIKIDFRSKKRIT